MEEKEDLEAFTNVLRSRFYNSGYREGLFKGKSEVIQEGFDRGYEVSALYAVMKVLQEAFITDETEAEAVEEEGDIEEEEILKEIEVIKETLQERIPEIKIASNLFK